MENTSAYLAEIFRAALISVDKGQTEAAISTGLTYRQAVWGIVLPQAVRNAVPATGNMFIGLIKNSSLAFTIGVTELLAQGKLLATATLQFFEAVAAGRMERRYIAIGRQRGVQGLWDSYEDDAFVRNREDDRGDFFRCFKNRIIGATDFPGYWRGWKKPAITGRGQYIGDTLRENLGSVYEGKKQFFLQ